MDNRITDSLYTILEHWTLGELVQAHTVMDALDKAQSEAMERNNA